MADTQRTGNRRKTHKQLSQKRQDCLTHLRLYNAFIVLRISVNHSMIPIPPFSPPLVAKKVATFVNISSTFTVLIPERLRPKKFSNVKTLAF